MKAEPNPKELFNYNNDETNMIGLQGTGEND